MINVIKNSIHPKKNHVTNLICLIVKQFIYRKRCEGSALSFYALLNTIPSIQNIEKYVAIKKDKLHVHNRKWKDVQDEVRNQNPIQEIVERHLDSIQL